jgi:hypothetical protein
MWLSRKGGFSTRCRDYLDFLPFSRSFYVVDIYTSKQQRLSFPRKIVASLCTNGFSTHACKEAALSTIKETAKLLYPPETGQGNKIE